MGKESPAVYSTFVINIINWLTGRKFITNMRYAQHISPRSDVPPHLPPGPHDKLSENYYYNRDARREVSPPIITFIGHTSYDPRNLLTGTSEKVDSLKTTQLLPDPFLKELDKNIDALKTENINPTLGHRF